MYYGYAGKTLEVNLSGRNVAEEALDEGVAKKFLGGLGLAVKYLYDEVGPDVDPLDPNNLVIFANGPLTATASPTNGRTAVVTKSPLTGSIGTGNFGSWWGVRLKRAGYDAVVLRGACDEPSYLWIEDGCVEIRSAGHLWGKDSWETIDLLQEELGEDVSVVAIGQAGENLVKFACPVADYHHAPGRSHAGCVMGTKRLKAIAVRGSSTEVAIAKPEHFEEAVKAVRQRISAYPERGERQKTGSNYLNKAAAQRGSLACRNFQTAVLPQDSEIWQFPDSVRNSSKIGSEFGYNCPLSRFYGCNLVSDVKTGDYAGREVGGIFLSYDGWGWGASCGIKSYPAMWKCRELSQRYGMDFTGPMPFAMELYQRGIITQDDTDGLDLKWGSEHAIMEMLRRIAYREGFGDLLADGSKRAAERIGKGAEQYALTIKGKELQYFDPRTGPYAKNLGMIASPRGDDLNTTHGIVWTMPGWASEAGWSKEKYFEWFYDWLDIFEEVKGQIFGVPPRLEALDARSPLGKAALTKWFGEITSVFNSLDSCLFASNPFTAVGPTHFAKLYSACTGWDITPKEIMKAGERIFNMMKAYMVREGFSRKDDDWPDRFYDEAVPDGPAKGAILRREDVQRLLDEYFELMGWDKSSGFQIKENLIELGLEGVAGELEEIGRLAKG